MNHLSPADELAELRAEIARLKMREAALRRQFLQHPDRDCLGRWSRVEVVESRQQHFIPGLLPAEIRNDPRYSEERVITAVHCRAASFLVTLRPGWPLRIGSVALH